jgi:putative membrane protein
MPALHFAQGLLMGGADIIPGVSGGTMALIVGIYERLIDSLSSGFSMLVSLARLRVGEAWEHAREVDWGLVIPLLAGIVTAIGAASFFLPHLIETYPHEMRGLFLGLVAASIAVPWLRIGRFTPRLILLALAGAIAAFLVVGLPLLEVEPRPGFLRILASASIAICAMILPGVSGAFLLEVLGIYRPTVEALRAAIGLDLHAIGYVAVFVTGAVVGLGLFSKSLDWLLDHYHDATMAALVGLMAGSLRALWPWQPWESHERVLLWPGTGDPVATVVLLAAAGFAFVALLTWWGSRRITGGR